MSPPQTAQAAGQRPPLPPSTRETVTQKVRLASDAWNSRDAEKVSLACKLQTPRRV
jgi:nuclear transport factor 2 (NTF2) superfamily protein